MESCRRTFHRFRRGHSHVHGQVFRLFADQDHSCCAPFDVRMRDDRPLPPANYDAMVVMPHGPNSSVSDGEGFGSRRCAQTSGRIRTLILVSATLAVGLDPGHGGKSFEYADTAGEDAGMPTHFHREEIAQHRHRDACGSSATAKCTT